MTSLRIVDTMEIASPCPADWNEMLGDHRARFCGQCEKHVYNLSAMTEPEIEELIEQTEGRFCGRLFRRTDGTMLTTDCPVGLAAKMKKAARRMWLMAATFLAGLLGGGAYLFGAATMGEVEPAMGAVVSEPPVMGDIDVGFEQGEVALPEDVVEVKGDIKVAPRPKMGKIKIDRD